MQNVGKVTFEAKNAGIDCRRDSWEEGKVLGHDYGRGLGTGVENKTETWERSKDKSGRRLALGDQMPLLPHFVGVNLSPCSALLSSLVS